MIEPKKLLKGDTVSLIATSSSVEKEQVHSAINFLESFGFNVLVGESCYSSYGFLSGYDYIRANDLNNAFSNKKVKGIFVIRGGYGAARILDLLDFKVIKKNPKIFLGFSDITILHTVLNQKCNLITYHGPMVGSVFYNDKVSLNSFEKNILNLDVTLNNKIENPSEQPFKTLKNGKVKGVLTGGNLSLICSTLGTNYEINTKNKILFLEEIEEEPYKIDRMLIQLIQSKKLSDCSGIILGSFKNCIANNPNKSLSLENIFNELLVPLNKPILSNLSSGHCLPNITLPLGKTMLLECSDHSCITILN